MQAYFEAADLGACNCAALVFPSPGVCSGITDEGPCNHNSSCASCLTDFAIEQNGARLTPSAVGGTDPWARTYDPPPPP